MLHDKTLPPPPEAEGQYHVYQLCYGRAGNRRVSSNFLYHHGDLHDAPMDADYNLWVLHGKDRTILVDTGFSPRASAERNRPLGIDPCLALAQIGLDPDQISDIIITHLHFDHAGNLDRFDKAHFHAQELEVAYATGPCMCHGVMRMPYDVEDVVTFVRHTYAERVTFYDGGGAPFPGVELHLMGGHSRGVQAVRVMTPRGPIVLASDVAHFYANFLRNNPFSVTVDAEETLRAYRRLRELGGRTLDIVPGHDPKTRAVFPQIVVNGLELTVLHAEPKPIADAWLAQLDNFAEMFEGR